jgi:hypothetical protein
MPTSSPFTRSAVIAATVIALGASPAVARQADLPVDQAPAVAAAHHSRQWTQPRTEGIGVRPVEQPVAASPVTAEPLTQAPHASNGTDWLLIAIGSTAVLALLLAVAVLPTRWLHVRPFRARQV